MSILSTNWQFCILLIRGGLGTWIFKIKKSFRMSRIFWPFLTEIDVFGLWSIFKLVTKVMWLIREDCGRFCSLEPPNPPGMSKNWLIFDVIFRVILFLINPSNWKPKALSKVHQINVWKCIVFTSPQILRKWAKTLLIRYQCENLKDFMCVLR